METNKKDDFKKYMLMFAAMMIVILVICFLPKIYKTVSPESNEGEINIKEDTGLEEDPYEVIDGPTGGDGQAMFKETYTNGKELMDAGLYLNASYILLTSFEEFKRENDGYQYVETLTYITGTFEENDSQQTFMVMLNGNENKTLKAVYNKTDRTLTYIKQ